MSKHEFELYLSLLSRFLRLSPGQRSEIADELRDHLEERLDELQAGGLSRDEAVRRALDEFGDAAELATHFTQLARRRQRRFLMRCTLASIAAASAVILIGFAMWPDMPEGNLPPRAIAQAPAGDFEPPDFATDDVPVDSPKKDQRQAAVEAKLASEVEQLNFVEVPLNKALETIGEQVKVDILINAAALNDEGVRLDQPVSLELKHTKVSAATAIQLILDRAVGTGTLAYKIRDGYVYIQTTIASEEDLEIEVYDVRDLLEGVQPISQLVYPGQRQVEITMSPGRLLIEVITKSTVGPWMEVGSTAADKYLAGQGSGTKATAGSWAEVGGTAGTIAEFDGTLVVRQTQKSHEEIKRLLEMLRATKKGQDGAK